MPEESRSHPTPHWLEASENCGFVLWVGSVSLCHQGCLVCLAGEASSSSLARELHGLLRFSAVLTLL